MPNHWGGFCKSFLTVVFPEPFGPANIRSRGVALFMTSLPGANRVFFARRELPQRGGARSFNPNQKSILNEDNGIPRQGRALLSRG
jgi:hypothetical protein